MMSPFLTHSLDVDGNFQRVVDSINVSLKRFVNLIQLEMMRDDRVRRELTGTHERQRAAAVHSALASRRIDADIAADREIHVHLHRSRVPGHDANATAALDVLERLLHGGRATSALEDGVCPFPARDLANAIGQILRSYIDREVRAKALADLQARVAGAAEDDSFRSERLAELNRSKPDRPRPEDQHRLASDITADEIDRPEWRGGGGQHAGLLEREVVGEAVGGVDGIDGVLSEATIAGETCRSVPFCEIAVIHSRGVPCLELILSAFTR